MTELDPEPDWWPSGADPDLVDECNCDYCNDLIDRLETWREGRVPGDEKQATLKFPSSSEVSS